MRLGLNSFSGNAVAIMMADLSDSPSGSCSYWEKLQEGHECVFGSRFIAGSNVIDYPKAKLVANRIVNTAIRYAFKIPCNDITNAFKIYRREVIEGCKPFISPHFNLTVEIPLKAIIQGFLLDHNPDLMEKQIKGCGQIETSRNGIPLLFYHRLPLAGEIF